MLCYKLVRQVNGRLLSISDSLPSGWEVEYKVGEFTVPNFINTCLFAFSADAYEQGLIKDAVKNGLELYAASYEGKLSYLPQTPHNIENFWKTGTSIPFNGMTEYGKSVTIAVRKIKLIERIL